MPHKKDHKEEKHHEMGHKKAAHHKKAHVAKKASAPHKKHARGK